MTAGEQYSLNGLWQSQYFILAPLSDNKNEEKYVNENSFTGIFALLKLGRNEASGSKWLTLTGVRQVAHMMQPRHRYVN